ncbi:MAG: Ig-like domain-containing protein [Flavobacteriaceae bacterium]|nr:Ig-like domain-containing protein [Flavobacteriaceae bacterium]
MKNGSAEEIKFESEIEDFDIYLSEEETIPVLGSKSHEGNLHVFTPAVPFSPGSNFEIRSDSVILAKFSVKIDSALSRPEILHIYPTTDTIPQNLLKIYIEFSEPMQNIGSTNEFIEVWNLSTQKQVPIFLKLENELWNQDRSMLTLWLDPGRIKKDLIPNREMGMPLEAENLYEIRVSQKWQSAKGNELPEDYFKRLYVIKEDKSKPIPKQWKLHLPDIGSHDILKIDFNEVMDSQLALETISIFNDKQQELRGDFQLQSNETGITFEPLQNWDKGTYMIKIEARLEDLAGNNLNRLFDTDLSQTDSNYAKEVGYYYLHFNLK